MNRSSHHRSARPTRARNAILAGSALLLLFGGAACSQPEAATSTTDKPVVTTNPAPPETQSTRKPIVLDATHEPLRDQFNADAEFARLVVIVSPT